jgi:hypothetical protein
MKVINNIILILIFIFRIYLVYKILSGLYFNIQNPVLYPITNLTWYVYFMICDFYIMNIFKEE